MSTAYYKALVAKPQMQHFINKTLHSWASQGESVSQAEAAAQRSSQQQQQQHEHDPAGAAGAAGAAATAVVHRSYWHRAPAVDLDNSRIHLAARANDADTVRALLRADPARTLLNIGDRRNSTPLHVAAGAGAVAACRALIDAGAFLDLADDALFTPLTVAVLGNKTEVVRLLFAATDARNAQLFGGAAPAAAAAAPAADEEERVTVNVFHQVHDGSNVAHLATQNGNLELLNLCLDYCERNFVRPHQQRRPLDRLCNTTKHDSWTPLLMAASLDLPEIVRTLITRGGADTEQRLPQAVGAATPLIIAAAAGKLGALRALLELHASLTATKHDGWSVLMCSVSQADNADVVRAILAEADRRGVLDAVLGHRLADDATACYLASQFGRRAALRVMMQEFGADSTLTKNDGWSCLGIASATNRDGIVMDLIEFYLKTAEKKKNSSSSSSSSSSADAKTWLHDIINARTETSGETPIMCAAVKHRGNGHLDATRATSAENDERCRAIVQTLLALKFEDEFVTDADATNSSGWTALCLAAQDSNAPAMAALVVEGSLATGGAAATAAAGKQQQQQRRRRINVNHQVPDGGTAAYVASQNGFVEGLRILRQHPDFDVRVLKNDGFSCALIAVGKSHPDVLRFLVRECGVDVNARYLESKVTALIAAGEAGRPDCIRVLLDELGANPNLRHAEGFSALLLAALSGNIDSVRVLLAHPRTERNAKAPGGSTACAIAVEQGNAALLEVLLEDPGVDANIAKDDSFTALMMAAASPAGLDAAADGDRVACVRVLLKQGKRVNLDARNSHKMTALFMASGQGNCDVLRVMMSRNEEWYSRIDWNARNADNFTPLLIALYNNKLDALRLLLNEPKVDKAVRVPPNQVDAFLLCAERSNAAAAAILLQESDRGRKFHVDLNSMRRDKCTAALIAAMKNDVTFMRFLLLVGEGGALDLSIVNLDSFGPLHAAVHFGHKQMCELLLSVAVSKKHKCDIAARVHDGATILHLAVQRQDLGLVKMILAAAANLNSTSDASRFKNAVRSTDNVSAVFLATVSGQPKILEALVRAKCDATIPAQMRFPPILAAIEHGHMQCVRILVEETGGSVRSDALRPLGFADLVSCAVMKQKPEIVQYLASRKL